MNLKNSNKSFVVAVRSLNANSFGLTKHIIVGEDGETFSFCRSRGPWHAEWPAGTVLQFSTDREGRVTPGGHLGSLELWERLPEMPATLVSNFWKGAIV